MCFDSVGRKLFDDHVSHRSNNRNNNTILTNENFFDNDRVITGSFYTTGR